MEAILYWPLRGPDDDPEAAVTAIREELKIKEASYYGTPAGTGTRAVAPWMPPLIRASRTWGAGMLHGPTIPGDYVPRIWHNPQRQLGEHGNEPVGWLTSGGNALIVGVPRIPAPALAIYVGGSRNGIPWGVLAPAISTLDPCGPAVEKMISTTPGRPPWMASREGQEADRLGEIGFQWEEVE